MSRFSCIVAFCLAVGSTSLAPVVAEPDSNAASKAAETGTELKPAVSAQAVAPLKKGDSVPAVDSLKNMKGEAVSLSQVLAGKTTVVVFYRGGWCPYCSLHLAELAKVMPELEKNGVGLVAISPESPEHMRETASKNNLSYTILSDTTYAAMKAFGVAFTVDEETVTKYKGYGIDLPKWSGNAEAVLPVPSVFVVDAEGKITFSHSDPDYSVRLSGDEILKAAGVIKPSAESAK